MRGAGASSLAERLDAGAMGVSQEEEEDGSAALGALQAALQDQQRRLSVACAQTAEFATSKEEEAKALMNQLLSLAAAVESKPDAAAMVQRMVARLSGAAAEAAALARTHLEEAAKAAAASGAAAPGEAPPPPSADADFADAADDDAELPDADGAAVSGVSPPLLDEPDAASGDFTDRARYIPVRLTLGERKRLRLLEAALSVSEYTDKVDILSYSKSKVQRINKQLLEICATLCGLVVAMDFKIGQDLIADKDFKENAAFFQMMFEIGRRHKVMNPDRMRTEYGKLVYMLQDSQLPEVQALLEFRIVTPLKTVHSVLEAGGCLPLLADPLMQTAVGEIYQDGRQRAAIAKDIRAKEAAREKLARKYARSGGPSEDELLACIYSIADNAAYLRFNRDPVDKMLWYLQHYFAPRDVEDRAFSLAISVGNGGARLSHPHERQYAYVLQSLTLWREVTHDMFRLWYLAEEDLLRENNWYRLSDTGQGLNRVQQAPAVSRAIHGLLRRCQERLGSWVGSSVVHLGDHNVPNALMFIDKYTQVPRILAPVVLVIEQVDTLAQDAGICAYINAQFGSAERLKKTILTDFFRHAFDGSGADNFFDAGSCIDGRLTSAWHWCSQIEKKSYFPIFKLAGFNSFDGDFKA